MCTRKGHARFMRRLRSAGTTGHWGIVLGLLLAVGPLVQAVGASPCSRAATSSVPEAVTATISSGGQWTCADVASATMVRAVSSEHTTPLRGSRLGGESTRLHTPGVRTDAMERSGPRVSISLVLRTLRPVVLQI